MSAKFSILIFLNLIPVQTHADQIRYLALPQQSLSAFAVEIDQAQRSIDIATYIFEPCHPSVRVLMEKLEARARSGVKVRILLDAFMQSQENQQNLQADFARYGIQVRFFDNTLAKIDLRMHSKFTVLDGQRYIAGGRNYSDSYFGVSSALNYIDRDVLVEGPSAQVAAKAFQELWTSGMTSVPQRLAFVKWNSFCASNQDSRLWEIATYLKQNAAQVLSSVPRRSCARVSFNNDHADYTSGRYGSGWNSGRNAQTYLSRARLNRKTATREIMDFISSTKSELEVENWSYMPIFDIASAFQSLRDRKVKVDVLANQDMEDDGPRFFREAEEYAVATLSVRDSVQSQAVELLSSLGSMSNTYELTPAGSRFFLHGKVMTRDHVDALVSSFNLDSRSANINLETSVTALNCPDLAADIKSRTAEVRAAYDHDQKSGQVPVKPEPSAFAKVFANLGITEF